MAIEGEIRKQAVPQFVQVRRKSTNEVILVLKDASEIVTELHNYSRGVGEIDVAFKLVGDAFYDRCPDSIRDVRCGRLVRHQMIDVAFCP